MLRQTKDFVRVGGGKVWEDETLKDWPENDFRLFIGDIAKEVTDSCFAYATPPGDDMLLIDYDGDVDPSLRWVQILRQS